MSTFRILQHYMLKLTPERNIFLLIRSIYWYFGRYNLTCMNIRHGVNSITKLELLIYKNGIAIDKFGIAIGFEVCCKN